MDDSKFDEKIDNIDGNHGSIINNSNNSFKSQNDLLNFIKCSFLVGADKLLFTQRSFKETTVSSKYDMQFSDVKVCEKPMCSFLDTNSTSLTLKNISNDMVTFVTLLVLKLAAFQTDLLMGFLRFPFKLLNLWLTLLMFPFQTLTLVKNHLKKKLVSICKNCFMSLVYFTFEKLRMQRSLLRLSVRICWAICWSIYVWFVLVGLLFLGFIIGGITMKHLVQEPIQTTEPLNFDYTKPTPVAFVPLTSSPVPGVSNDFVSKDKKAFSKHVGGRSIPYHHNLKLSLSLTMPESDYNRNLGIFQVRIECLSADGKVTASFTHPSMLQYKSQSIKYIETFFKSIPLLTGIQSEAQNLKVGAIVFTEGIEPTACFKVTIEERARYESGFGLPEIYAASMNIETQLPKLKRLIWNWRKTVFVWLSLSVFLFEVAIFVIFCRPIILPGKALKVLGAKGKLIKSH